MQGTWWRAILSEVISTWQYPVSRQKRQLRRPHASHSPMQVTVLEHRHLLAGFTPGNLIINTVGTGAALDGTATPVTLREYGLDNIDSPTTATLVNSIAAPSGNSGNNSGNLTDSGSATSHGAINLSVDGTRLSFVGYDAPTGLANVATSSTANNNRVVGTVSAGGQLTLDSYADAFSSGGIRAAISTSGTTHWIAGSTGVRYAAAGTSVSVTSNAARFVTIATDTSGNQFLAGNTGTTVFVWASPSPLPTSGVTPQTLTLPGLSSDLGEIVMLDRSVTRGATNLGGIDTIYVTNGQSAATGTILKYEWTGSAWASRGSRSFSTAGLNGLTARITASGDVQLFATTRISSGNNLLLTRTDTAGFGADISAGAYVTLASAGPGYAFRGLSFAPDEAAEAALNVSGAGLVNAGGAPVSLINHVTYANGSSFKGGALVVTGGQAGDSLSITDVTGQITTSGNTVLYDGTPIGTFSGGTGTTELRIDFNPRHDAHDVTTAMVEQLLQQLQMTTTSTDSLRSLTITLTQAADHKSQIDSTSQTISVAINQPPSAVAFSNSVTTLAEQTLAADQKVADLLITDDALGTNTITLSGADAAAFDVVGQELFLRAGEYSSSVKSSYAVTVVVDDLAAGLTPDATATFSLTIVGGNQAPTAVQLANSLASIAENTNTVGGVKVADVNVTDDAVGTNVLTLGGTDAASFEFRGSELWLKSGVPLNFEAQNSYSLTVSVDDAAIGSAPDATVDFTLAVTDANEPPTIGLSGAVTQLPENALSPSPRKMADIVITDDALGTETLSLSGPGAALFDLVGTELFLKAGTIFDFETQAHYSVNVDVDDLTLGSGVDQSATLNLQILDSFEPPEIDVAVNGNSIADGGAVNFGSVSLGAAATRTFTVANVGSGVLMLQPISITGGDFVVTNGNFTVGQTLAANASVSFTVSMSTVAAGSKSGALSFLNSDAGESPYNIELSGAVATPASTTFIDDGDAGFALSGSWSNVAGYGYAGDAKVATGSDGSRKATWTFGGLSAGQYRIEATWLPGTDRANAVPYTFRDGIGGATIGNAFVNQRTAPSGAPSAGGRPFASLGMVTITGNTLVVELSNTMTNGAIIADAVRIVNITPPPNTPEIDVLDGALVLSDGAVFDFGQVTQGTTVTKSFTVRNSGTADLTLQPIVVTGAAFSLHSANFTVGQILAHDATATITIAFNTANLGTYTGGLSFGNSDVDEGPFDLTVSGKVNPAGATVFTLDDGDAGFTLTGAWNNVAGYGHDRDAKAATGSNGANKATWTFSGLVAGEYNVDTTWLPGTDRADNAAYVIRDGVAGTILATVGVNQRNAPSGAASDGGRPFASLGSVTITGSALVVELANTGTNGAIIADAVRIKRLTAAPDTPRLVVNDGANSLIDNGTLNFGSGAQHGPALTKTISIKNTGTANLLLQPITLSGMGFSLVSANFTAGQALAPNASIEITVQLSATNTGTFSGTLSFGHNDGGPFDLQLTGTINAALPAGVFLIDDGDSGFATTGLWNNVAGYGYGSDAQAATGNDGSKKAIWNFSELATGTYRVDVTWLPGTDRANNAPYLVRDGVGGPVLASINVNQRIAPAGATSAGGRPFSTIATVTVSGNALVVELSNFGTTGAIIADAIRLTKIS